MTPRTRFTRTVVALVLRAAWVLSASTAASGETLEERDACIGDAFQFCSSAIPDRGRVYGCLLDHKDVISAACHAVITPDGAVDQASAQKQPPRNASANRQPLTISTH
jgi:hypothetical protein